MAAVRRERRRDEAVAELLSSEAEYVSDLKLLVDVFLLPLQRWAKELEAQQDPVLDHAAVHGGSIQARSAPSFTQADCKEIFANTLELAHFNRQFLLDLRKAHGGPFVPGSVGVVSPVSTSTECNEWRKVTSAGRDCLEGEDIGDPLRPTSPNISEKGPRQMLQVFLKSAPFLKMYSEYVNNFDTARERLTALERDNSSFSAFLTACEKQKPCRGLHLRDFLVLPVQRIPRYRLLLETILQYTSIDSNMHSAVEESLSTMGGIASKINSDLSLKLKRNKVYQLQQEFGGASFVTASRLFVREGDLFKVARNGVEKLHFVLFNDLLVYGQAKRRRPLLRRGSSREQLYHHRRDMNLSNCFIVDAPSYGSRCSSFLGETGMLVISEEKTFMVMASTAVEKDGWLQAIRLCMRELSTSNSVVARERGYGSSRNQVVDDARAQRRRRQHATCSPPGSSSSSPQSWSVASHSPMAASAPRSVWVPGKNGSHKTSSLRLVEFCLPPWAGVRTSCGCLSHTELTWGKDSLAAGGQDQGLGGVAGGMSGVGWSPNGGDSRNVGVGAAPYSDLRQSGGTPQPRSGTTSPRKVALVISMRPSEPMGLRLRDVHPECGGGVVVIGFERSAAGKRAGVLQGDRITEVNESPASGEDDEDASVPSPVLSAPGRKTFSGRGTSGNNTLGFAGFYSGGGGGNSAATAVNYSPEEPPPSAATASSTTPRVPDNITVNTPVAPSPEAVLSAPGRKTFSGGGGAARRSSKSGSLGFGFSGADDEQEPAPTLTQQQRRQRAFLSTTATTVELGKSGGDGGGGSSSSHALTLAVDNPPSPDETKGDEDSGEWGDSNGSADSTGGGRPLKVPAPTQANVNAGGDPAVPFATFRGGGRATPSREGQGQGQGRGHGMPSLRLGVGSALAACWGVQETNDNDENSRPTEFDLGNSEEVEVEERIVVRKPPPVLVAMSRGTSATSSTVGGAGDYGEYDEVFGDDARSAAGSSGSGSSRDSSLLLTAVSPSRVPPPLVSVASWGTLPPVSRASSCSLGGLVLQPWAIPHPEPPPPAAAAACRQQQQQRG
ncbi:pleckstrin homology (PH) domain-containing protein [Ectocarpus siliculosus]|uniref:Pleckstrin homology (PH) domain-containing protein n=1 Tax=Ectocarpus siliculosus TaxID=2880 RepID=D8LKY8_ECTSI|nr:pleckstrin homology (PH) domain-containing protein [Ectocarpus siliculosus]|eukprot:CBN80121.1 pleckstrin homology (PH) domain-containing protein [Ectocarpus siliculosus]